MRDAEDWPADITATPCLAAWKRAAEEFDESNLPSVATIQRKMGGLLRANSHQIGPAKPGDIYQGPERTTGALMTDIRKRRILAA